MYKTQMEAAKKGILTDQMKRVAQKEYMDPQLLMERVAQGKIAIPANVNHKSLLAEGVGLGLSTKINVNLGISRDCPYVDKELEKVKKAIDMKAEAIMDLSSFGKTEEFRKKLIAMSSAMIGTVPVYDAIGFYDKELKDITADEFLDVVRKHAKDGVDFVTIHAGMNREAMKVFKRNKRITNIVSRGGSLMYAWMELNDAENPFFERYDGRNSRWIETGGSDGERGSAGRFCIFGIWQSAGVAGRGGRGDIQSPPTGAAAPFTAGSADKNASRKCADKTPAFG